MVHRAARRAMGSRETLEKPIPAHTGAGSCRPESPAVASGSSGRSAGPQGCGHGDLGANVPPN